MVLAVVVVVELVSVVDDPAISVAPADVVVEEDNHGRVHMMAAL
jgi:hypothetical protein